MTFEADANSYEAAAERKAEQKLLFHPCRRWYADKRNVRLQAAHGLFPAMWMELEAWAGWKSVRKEYLKFQDTGEWAGAAPAAAPAAPAAPAAAPAVDAKTLEELHGPLGEWYAASDLRARHGAYPETAEALAAWPAFGEATEQFLAATVEPPAPRRKRSRFGKRDATTTENAAPASLETKRLARAQREALAASQLTVVAPDAARQLALAAARARTGAGAPTQERRQELMLLQMRLRTLQERTMDFASEFEKWRDDPRRVDPPPVYGPDGSRANTPEVLFRQELARERSLLLKKIRAIEPSAATALGDAPARPSRRLYIPQKEFPNVCFMGLILGPRGNHHKRMEAQTGCRIRVRGRGSLREGSRGRDAQRDFEDDQDDMHVFVEGPTEAQVQEACALIEPLLNPESGKVDELKEKHQTELAEINGTQRQETYCHICGEKGHLQWECPAKQRSYAMANVRCALCGDTSHPTRDCVLNKNGAAEAVETGAQEAPVKVDAEFLDFMSELGAEPGLGFKKPEAVSAQVAAAAPPPVPAPTNLQAQQQQRYGSYYPGYHPPA
jgi:splicing factor 1